MNPDENARAGSYFGTDAAVDGSRGLYFARIVLVKNGLIWGQCPRPFRSGSKGAVRALADGAALFLSCPPPAQGQAAAVRCSGTRGPGRDSAPSLSEDVAEFSAGPVESGGPIPIGHDPEEGPRVIKLAHTQLSGILWQLLLSPLLGQTAFPSEAERPHFSVPKRRKGSRREGHLSRPRRTERNRHNEICPPVFLQLNTGL